MQTSVARSALSVALLTVCVTRLPAAELGVGYLNSVEEVAKLADVVTIHCALTPETKRV